MVGSTCVMLLVLDTVLETMCLARKAATRKSQIVPPGRQQYSAAVLVTAVQQLAGHAGTRACVCVLCESVRRMAAFRDSALIFCTKKFPSPIANLRADKRKCKLKHFSDQH